MPVASDARELLPYVARLHADWQARHPELLHRRLAGTLVFADISGFTALTERLTRKGKVGAEEMSDALNSVFSDILQPAHAHGADLVKWGGDAVLLLFDGPAHAIRACRASYEMRARLREFKGVGQGGPTRLRMSIGVHSGEFDFYNVGDPDLHRELLVSGPEVSRCVRLESVASAGEIAISHDTLAEVGRAHRGRDVSDDGVLLKGCPDVSGSGVLALPRPEVDVRPLLPREIRAHLLRGEADPEHRDIAVGFVKFTGTDRLAIEEGPDAVAAALDEVIRNVASATDEFGVTFFETDLDADGGKVMLAAGVPTSAGHHSERMLRATRLMLDRAGRLQLKIGVNFGHVFAGDFGPEFRRTYSIKGDPINLAARVMGKAEPGTLLATRAAVERSETVFDTTQLPPFRVKGKQYDVHALRVGRVLETPRDRRSHASLLVGRAVELEAIEAAVDGIESGRGCAIELVGPPGIGKSRLLSEALRLAGENRVHQVQCVEYDASSPYHLFWVLLHNMLGLSVGATDDPAVELYADHVRRVAPDLMPWFPLLCAPLQYAVDETEETAGLDEQFRRDRIEELVTEFLHRLMPDPHVLIFDDVQYVDGASVGILNRLVRSLDDRPVLVVLGRHDVTDGWYPTDGVDVQTLALQPLSGSDSLRLVQAGNAAHPLPQQLAEALAAKAGGNPLFLQSLLAEAGPQGDVSDLPDSVSELLTTQIDRLPPEDRTMLRRASVLGTGFDLAQLPLLFDDAPETASLERLHEFLQVEPGRRWASFRHGLIRDVAYEGLPYKVRRDLHSRIGSALERAGDAVGSRPELLSLHFFHAHRYDKAWAYARHAGDLAKAKYANSEAVDQYARAIEAAKRLPPAVVPKVALAHAYESLGDCWFTIGVNESAAGAFGNARKLVKDDVVAATLLVGKEASVEQRLRRFPQALRRLGRGLHVLDGIEGRPANKARCRLCLTYAQVRLGQGRIENAIEWATRAAAEAQIAGDRTVIAQAYATLHGIHVAIGRECPLPYGDMALQEYVELDDLGGQAHCTNNLAVEALDQAKWQEAERMFGRAAEIFRRLGDTASEANAICNQAEVLVNQGRLSEAEPMLTQVLTAARSVDDEELLALALRQLGRCLCRAGDFESGLRHLEEARAIFHSIDEDEEIAGVVAIEAELRLLAGDRERAVSLTEELLAASVDGLEPDLRWVRGFALIGTSRVDEAVVEFVAGVERAEEEGNRFAFAMNCLGLAEAGAPDALERKAMAAEVLSSLGVVYLPLDAAAAVVPTSGS